MRKILSAALALVCIWFATPSWGANCNLFHLEPQTLNGVTLTIRDDGAYVLNGTCNSNGNFLLGLQSLGAGTYTLAVIDREPNPDMTGTQVQAYSPSDLNTNMVIKMSDGANYVTRTFDTDYNDVQYRIRVQAGITYDNYVIKPMFVKGATVPTAYTPYNPLCATCDGTIVNYVSATGTVSQSGTPTPDNPIYPTFYTQGNMVLRKVGNVADSYDASTGKITRRVGVAVLDGTERWGAHASNAGWFQLSSDIFPTDVNTDALSTHYRQYTHNPSSMANQDILFGRPDSSTGRVVIRDAINFPDVGLADDFKSWLAQQYAAGTPVTVYYPLKTETTEDWPASYCETPIKIATTKYNETAFGPLNTALANAISVVDTVVSNTITQAGRIATLQTQKQTRPNDIADDNEKCPAGKKCLLVEDASGIPHWYEIVTGRLPDGYTELEYIESTGTQWIDPDINITSTNIATFKSEAVISNVTREGGSISGYSSPSSKLWYGLTSTSPYEFYYSDGHQEKSLNVVSEFRYYKYVIDAPNGSYSVYTESDEAVTSKTGLNFSTSNDFKFYLFTYSPAGSASAFKPQKIKYAKFWFDGALVRNLVPALNPDGKIGMYDLVGGRFYENAGTGTFIGGQPVFN